MNDSKDKDRLHRHRRYGAHDPLNSVRVGVFIAGECGSCDKPLNQYDCLMLLAMIDGEPRADGFCGLECMLNKIELKLELIEKEEGEPT